MKQRTMLLRHLRRGETITPAAALDLYGIARLAARIQNLRDDGYEIETVMHQGHNRFGQPVRYAEYLLAEKQPNIA